MLSKFAKGYYFFITIYNDFVLSVLKLNSEVGCNKVAFDIVIVRQPALGLI